MDQLHCPPPALILQRLPHSLDGNGIYLKLKYYHLTFHSGSPVPKGQMKVKTYKDSQRRLLPTSFNVPAFSTATLHLFSKPQPHTTVWATQHSGAFCGSLPVSVLELPLLWSHVTSKTPWGGTEDVCPPVTLYCPFGQCVSSCSIRPQPFKEQFLAETNLSPLPSPSLQPTLLPLVPPQVILFLHSWSPQPSSRKIFGSSI